jgi:hypothetical protein
MATGGNARVIMSAEDRTAAAFAAVGKRVDKLGFNLNTLKGAAVGALGALAVPISAGAIIGLATEASKAVLEFKDLSEATGSSIENISGLDRIARTTGGSMENVTGVLVKFNAALKDADRTKEIGAILKELNLDIEELKRLDPADALQKTAIALEGFADNGARARAQQELFGRSVKDAAPFLRELAEAGQLNATVTTEQVLEIDKFNKEMARLQSNTQDVARSLSIDLITSLNEVIAKFREGTKEGKGFFATAFQIYKNNVAEFYGNGPKTPTFDPNDQSAAELARLTRRPTLQLPDAPEKPGKGKGKGGRSTGGGATKDPYAEGNRYLESLRKQLEATENLSEVEQALRDIQLGRLGKLKPAQEQAILDTARLIDADKELQKATKEFADLEANAIERKKELAEAGARVYEETRTPLEKLNIEVAELQRLLDAGAISFDTFARKNFELEDAVAGLGKEVSELDKYTQQAAANIQDALGDSFSQAMKGNFSDIEDNFLNLINNMVAQALAADLSKALFGDLAKGGSSGGGAGDFLGTLVGGLFGSSPRFATGTDFVPKDMLAVVHKGEKITPASQNTGRRQGGDTRNYYVSVAMPQGGSRATALQFGTDAARQLNRASARNG